MKPTQTKAKRQVGRLVFTWFLAVLIVLFGLYALHLLSGVAGIKYCGSGSINTYNNPIIASQQLLPSSRIQGFWALALLMPLVFFAYFNFKSIYDLNYLNKKWYMNLALQILATLIITFIFLAMLSDESLRGFCG